MPALEALLGRFEKAHTLPVGVSIDSVHSHANWAKSLGGVSFPLVADFHPKGQVAQSYGLYLDGAGITDRATVIIDAHGVIRHISSVTPAGKRDMGALAAECEAIDAAHDGDLPDVAAPSGLPAGTSIFVKDDCGFSRAVLLAVDNLHLGGRVVVKNVTQDPAARDELSKRTGKDQAPAMVSAEGTLQDSKEIIDDLVSRTTSL